MDQGYEDSRFENAVDRNFHCPICMNVLKEAMQCRMRNEHYFCSSCVRRHLEQNSQSCPLCIDELTIETLRKAPRIVTDYLSSLKINCDHADRGCPEIVELGVLESHVANCNFFPVTCSNDGCSEVINKQDVELHETKACDFKKLVKCDDCDEQFPRSKYNAHGCVLSREMVEMRCLQEQMMNEVKSVSTEVKGVREEMAEMMCLQKQMMKEVKAMRVEMEHMTTQDLSGGRCHTNSREDIIALGGIDEAEPLPFVERFSGRDRKWTPLQRMKENRSAAAAVVFENQILVCGGMTQPGIGTDSIEKMHINQKPEQWFDIPAKLPFKCRGHKCVVYRNRLLVIGGCTNEGESSNGIYEVHLIPPYSSKFLCHMKQKRCYHGVELFDDKILIVGGQRSLENKDGLSNVEMYDITKNVCKEMPPLRYAIRCMATVRWSNNVILMGGTNYGDIGINSVISYDIKTGESKVLPSMKNKREGCAAVVSGKTIVVMGGYGAGESLGSVECFDFRYHSWIEMPAMITPRLYLTAL